MHPTRGARCCVAVRKDQRSMPAPGILFVLFFSKQLLLLIKSNPVTPESGTGLGTNSSREKGKVATLREMAGCWKGAGEESRR